MVTTLVVVVAVLVLLAARADHSARRVLAKRDEDRDPSHVRIVGRVPSPPYDQDADQ